MMSNLTESFLPMLFCRDLVLGPQPTLMSLPGSLRFLTWMRLPGALTFKDMVSIPCLWAVSFKTWHLLAPGMPSFPSDTQVGLVRVWFVQNKVFCVHE